MLQEVTGARGAVEEAQGEHKIVRKREKSARMHARTHARTLTRTVSGGERHKRQDRGVGVLLGPIDLVWRNLGVCNVLL